MNETTWFLVQTNYDRDQKDPLLDRRRVGVEEKIKEHGNKNFTKKDLFEKFMIVWPTFNIETIMTAIIVPSTGYYNTTIWYASNPSKRQTPTPAPTPPHTTK